MSRPTKIYEGVCPQCQKPWRSENKGGRPRIYCSSTCWRRHNAHDRRAYHAQWRKSNPDKVRRNKQTSIAKVYGLTLKEYEALLAKASHRCEVCGRKPMGSRADHLSVDHCHNTGKVRGILCTKCNTALGMMGDTPSQVEALLHYIEGTTC